MKINLFKISGWGAAAKVYQATVYQKHRSLHKA